MLVSALFAPLSAADITVAPKAWHYKQKFFLVHLYSARLIPCGICNFVASTAGNIFSDATLAGIIGNR